MFVQKIHPTPTNLIQAYAEVQKVSLQSPAIMNGALNYFGNANTLNQGALNYALTINPVGVASWSTYVTGSVHTTNLSPEHNKFYKDPRRKRRRKR